MNNSIVSLNSQMYKTPFYKAGDRRIFRAGQHQVPRRFPMGDFHQRAGPMQACPCSPIKMINLHAKVNEQNLM